MSKRQRIVVVGHGMVGHRFAQAAVERGLTETHDVLVLGEEPRAAYDRVALTSWFGQGSEALSLLPGGEYDDPRVRLVLDSVVTETNLGYLCARYSMPSWYSRNPAGPSGPALG